MLDTTSPRNQLRAAIAARDAATEVEANAVRAVVRAKQMLDDAEQTYSMLANVDDDIAKHHAGEIRRWAANGGEKPTGELPRLLASRKDFKAEAETKLAAARSAHELLKQELMAAVARMSSEKASVRRAAVAVLAEEADPIIDQLRQARRMVWALEDKLKSLSAVRFTESDGRSVLIRLPAATFAALNETAPPQLAGNVPQPYTIARERWEKYLDALTLDPEASLD
jgi:hypothetical protein